MRMYANCLRSVLCLQRIHFWGKYGVDLLCDFEHSVSIISPILVSGLVVTVISYSLNCIFIFSEKALCDGQLVNN